MRELHDFTPTCSCVITIVDEEIEITHNTKIYHTLIGYVKGIGWITLYIN